MKLKALVFRCGVLTCAALFFLPLSASAQSGGSSLPAASSAANADAEYVKVADGRADKIVATLKIDESAKAGRVRDLISQHYQNLKNTQAPLDAARKAAKTATAENKDKAKADLANVQSQTDAAIQGLHDKFVANLNAELPPEQVDKVKDGLTYGVVQVTFRRYQQVLPNLTAEQKAQILAWLVEAREHAIDGGSSAEKHGWFTKYKGRINNYLAKAGIDMKKAEKELEARPKGAGEEEAHQ